LPFTSKARRRLINTSFLAALTASTAVVAAPVAFDLDIPAGSLGAALTAFERQTRLEILYNPKIVEGRVSPAVKGRLSPDAALKRLVQNADIAVIWSGPNTITLRPRTLTVGSGSGAPVQTVRQDPPPAPAGEVAEPSEVTERLAPPAEVVVIGTHIRGLQANASPTVEVTRDDLTRLGDATVADALARLPQNFGGTANPVAAQIGSDRTATNTMAAEGVNLRGLGPGATLVLLNGHRMAGTGIMGNIADVSSIPTSAVDHVDVLLDGASAIYGSDAVGGVVNIVTRKDFDGAETIVRYGEAEGGYAPLLQVAQTVGTTWDGGHALLSYQHQRQGDLPASARKYTANSDLTALGGSNYDTNESSPGNILTLNASRTAYVSAFALPAGSGLGLTPSSFIAGATNYQNTRLDTVVSPNQTSDGVYLSAAQTLDPKTNITLDGRFNQRDFNSRSAASQTILTVTPTNPYYVSPNGAASELIGYSAADSLGPIQARGSLRAYDLVVGVDRDLFGSWRLSADVDVSGVHGARRVSNELNSSHLSEALGSTPDNPATAFSTSADGFFNPYGTSNSKAVLAFVGDGYSTEADDDQVLTSDLQIDGALFTLPGGVVKAAFGGQFRHERAEFLTDAVTTATPFVTGGTPYARDVAAVYGELNIPLVGTGNRLPGLESLTLSVAGRVEHYDDVGSTANPKIGVIWVPVKDVTIHASYGTSFRAPTLYELHYNPVIAAGAIPSPTGTTLSLVEYGGNPNLKPETATSWTAGGEWRPHQAPGLTLGATWFKIDYTNRIDDPGSSALATVLINPAYSVLVHKVDPTNPADIAEVKSLIAQSASSSAALFPPSAYGAIINANYLNVATLEVDGVDFNARYAATLGQDRVSLAATATYLADYKQQTTTASALTQFVSTPGEPVDWRGRATLDWMHGPFDTAFTVNWVNQYRDPVSQRTIDAWTTADLTATWRAPETTGPMQGLTFSAAIQNLFDADPPFYNSPFGVGFDPANANPFGRIWSVQLTKRW
jgi:outer membrane receptor protein involved in Fe transport